MAWPGSNPGKGKGKVGVECVMCSGGKGLEKLSSGSYRKL